MTAADLLACALAERAQTARLRARRADDALAAWLDLPAYQRRDTAHTLALADACRDTHTAAMRGCRWAWRTVVWSPGAGLAVEVGQA